MTALIVYDSQYGNTQKLAEVIAETLKGKVIKAPDFKMNMLDGLTLFVVGCPTQGGRPTVGLQTALNQIPNNALKGIKVAAFDTRFSENDQKFALRLLMKIIQYAAPRIAKALESKGGKLIVPPEGFIVTGKEGPLAEGELERAKDWAKKLLK